MNKERNQRNFTIALLVVYAAVLTWIILFKMSVSPSAIPKLRGINLIPYAASVIVNDTLDFREIIYNAIAFVPLGIYISMLKPEWSFVKKALPILLLSLGYEIIQYIFALGATDITDLINNTVGGIVGIAGYQLTVKISKDRFKINKVINVIATLCTAVLLSLMLILITVNI